MLDHSSLAERSRVAPIRAILTASPRAFASVALLALCALLLSACASVPSGLEDKRSQALGTIVYGTLPPVGTPVKGGTITQGQLTGLTPTYIFPIVPGADSSAGTISLLSELYMPLYAGPTGAEPKVDYALSAAEAPRFSDHDMTVTIPMRPGLHWSNGAPIDAEDVVFWFDILKAAVAESPANWGQYTPGLMPDNVKSVTTSGEYDVVMHLKEPFNPGFFQDNNLQDVNNVYPLPATDWNVDSAAGPHFSQSEWSQPAIAKKIYDYLSHAGAAVASFASNPLWQDVSGPFKLKSFSVTNSSYALAPNRSYGGAPKPIMKEVSVETFTSFTAELNALKSGALDIAVGIDPSQLPQAPALKAQGIDIFGGPEWGWFGGVINFKDKTDHFDRVIAQNYVREALDSLIDQPAIVKGVYKGAAVEDYGPTPSYPTSPYAPASATHATYPYDPAKAVALLRAHGWKVVPGGETTCQKAGTGAGECGAGIPAGTPISFTWANQPQSVSTVGALESEVFSSEAKEAAGIEVQLQTRQFDFLVSEYNDANPGASKYTNDWGVNNFGGLNTDYYPTASGIWNEQAGFNIGAYADPTADKLIEQSVHSANLNAIKTETSYFAAHPPVLFMPDQDYLLAVNTKKVGGPADGWTVMTQQLYYPQYWYTVR